MFRLSKLTASDGTPDPYMAATEATESMLLLERCPAFIVLGDCERIGVVVDVKSAGGMPGLPVGLAERAAGPRNVASLDSLTLGL